MSTLNNTYIDDTYLDLLQVSNGNSGIDGTLRNISSGTGTNAAIQISSSAVKFTGTVTYGSNAFSLGGAFSTSGAYPLVLTLTASTNVTLPTTGTLATIAGVETLTNKTLTSPIISSISNTGTITFPTTSTTLVGTDTTDTLTNKTITTPIIAQINDSSGNESIIFSSTGSAINEITITNAATGSGPSISATGGDTNIPVTLKGKGTGAVKLGQSSTTGIQLLADQPILDSNSNELLKFSKASLAVNEITISNAATTVSPTISVTGGDTNIDVNMQAKGSGAYNFLSTSSGPTVLRIYEDTDNGSNYIALSAPSTIAANRTISFPDTDLSTFIVQRQYVSVASQSTSASIPLDNTIPQNNEGVELTNTLSITPKKTSNKLVIRAKGFIYNASVSTAAFALFQDTTANAIKAVACSVAVANGNSHWSLEHTMDAGTTSSTTFKIRGGISTGTMFINSNNSFNLGGVMSEATYFEVIEYSV